MTSFFEENLDINQEIVSWLDNHSIDNFFMTSKSIKAIRLSKYLWSGLIAKKFGRPISIPPSTSVEDAYFVFNDFTGSYNNPNHWRYYIFESIRYQYDDIYSFILNCPIAFPHREDRMYSYHSVVQYIAFTAEITPFQRYKYLLELSRFKRPDFDLGKILIGMVDQGYYVLTDIIIEILFYLYPVHEDFIAVLPRKLGNWGFNIISSIKSVDLFLYAEIYFERDRLSRFDRDQIGRVYGMIAEVAIQRGNYDFVDYLLASGRLADISLERWLSIGFRSGKTEFICDRIDEIANVDWDLVIAQSNWKTIGRTMAQRMVERGQFINYSISVYITIITYIRTVEDLELLCSIIPEDPAGKLSSMEMPIYLVNVVSKELMARLIKHRIHVNENMIEYIKDPETMLLFLNNGLIGPETKI